MGETEVGRKPPVSGVPAVGLSLPPSLGFTCTGCGLLPHTPETLTGACGAGWGPTEPKPLEASLSPEQVGNRWLDAPALSPELGQLGACSTLSSRRSWQDWAPRARRASSSSTPPSLARSLPCLTVSRPCWHLLGPLSRQMTSDPASGGTQVRRMNFRLDQMSVFSMRLASFVFRVFGCSRTHKETRPFPG